MTRDRLACRCGRNSAKSDRQQHVDVRENIAFDISGVVFGKCCLVVGLSKSRGVDEVQWQLFLRKVERSSISRNSSETQQQHLQTALLQPTNIEFSSFESYAATAILLVGSHGAARSALVQYMQKLSAESPRFNLVETRTLIQYHIC